MSDTRPPKKSESLEIRIPYPTKQAFMARCRDEGRSASEVLRGLIETRLSGATIDAAKAARRRMRLIAGTLVALAVGAVAVPSLARAPHETQSRRAFERLDANHDGVVSYQEFRRAN
ncbi:EF-hand domain-containing protein [Phenylobacterium aquaticum]|uniref:EF-hand domain-containing protein n=1 Tax=Phenylobacterium aquaticum TaxID=1763816 RepID=UPI0026F1C57D|nr:EF-hand domain-containing protein [Phenylobacterium aquaticum]